MFKTNISHGFDSGKSQKIIATKYLKSSHSLNYKPTSITNATRGGGCLNRNTRFLFLSCILQATRG